MVSRKVFALSTKVKILVHLEIGIVSPVSETLKGFIHLFAFPNSSEYKPRLAWHRL